MAGKDDHVDVHRLHIDRHDARGLRGIDHKRHPRFAADCTDLCHRLDCTDHVGTVIDHDQARTLVNGLFYVAGIHVAVFIEWHTIHGDFT
jgi:hypothetical protein